VKQQVTLRISVLKPPAGVSFQLQKGRADLVPPAMRTDGAISFEFAVTVDLAEEPPNFLGKFVQGPKGGRFVYVNSGTLAGQADSCWTRRAKVSLMNITADQLKNAVEKPDIFLEAAIEGTGRDGGPACASVPLIGNGWKIHRKN
jgi:hypothetical protein